MKPNANSAAKPASSSLYGSPLNPQHYKNSGILTEGNDTSYKHYFRDSPRAMNGKPLFVSVQPGVNNRPVADPDDEIDEHCIQSAGRRGSRKASNRTKSVPGSKDELEEAEHHKSHLPEVFLDAFDYAYDPNISPDQKAKDAVNPKDVKYDIKHLKMNAKEITEFLKKWKYIEDKQDSRVPWAYDKGGVACTDAAMSKYRNIAKAVIQEVGKKMLSGSFNLTTVSFPIKSMLGESFLEKCNVSTCLYPLYMNLATATKDPLQRFKYVLAASVGYFCYLEVFGKPLNPILGETYHGSYSDGTTVCLEQISHHPPVSYILCNGPKKSYTAYGPYICEPSAGFTSMKLNTKGWRKILFNDNKQEITVVAPNDSYDGIFFGKCVHSFIGNLEMTDEKNGLSCKVTFGKVKKRPWDYYSGEITQNGKVVSKVNGTYLGWMEIDDQRYFDHRHVAPFKFNVAKSPLGSDSNYRADILMLQMGEVNQAQKDKETLEQLQRYDRKLRKAHNEKEGKEVKH